MDGMSGDKVFRCVAFVLALTGIFGTQVSAQTLVPGRSFRMEVSVDAVVDRESIRLARVIRCELYLNQYRRAFWSRSIQAFGQALASGAGIAVVTPNACEWLDQVRSRRRSGLMPRAEVDSLPPDFLPLVILSSNTVNFDTLELYVSREAYRRPGSRVTLGAVRVREAAPEARESEDDLFGWLKFAPSPGRADDRSIPPVAIYDGWIAVVFPTTALNQPATQYGSQSRFLQRNEWPNYAQLGASGFLPPSLADVLRGDSMPPCSSQLHRLSLCRSGSNFDRVIALRASASGYAAPQTDLGIIVAYRSLYRAFAADPLHPRFGLQADRMYYPATAGQRHVFFNSQTSELYDIFYQALILFDR